MSSPRTVISMLAGEFSPELFENLSEQKIVELLGLKNSSSNQDNSVVVKSVSPLKIASMLDQLRFFSAKPVAVERVAVNTASDKQNESSAGEIETIGIETMVSLEEADDIENDESSEDIFKLEIESEPERTYRR